MKKFLDYIVNNRHFNIVFYTFFTSFFVGCAITDYSVHSVGWGGILATVMAFIDATSLVLWLTSKKETITLTVSDKQEEK